MNVWGIDVRARIILLTGCSVICACASAQSQDPFLLLEKGMLDTAEREFRAQMQQRPTDAKLKDGLGAALAGLGRYQEGCALLAPASRPLSAPECWIRAAREALEQQRHRTVLAYANRINSAGWSKEQIAEFYEVSMQAASKERDWDHLIEAFPTLLQSDPENADYHYRFARALEQREYYQRAFREYETALVLDPDNEAVKRYMNRLKVMMERSGTTSAARVEEIQQTEPTDTPEGQLSTMRVSAWEHGSVEAIIQIEELDSAQAEDDISEQLISVPVEVVTAHWPSGANQNLVLGYISRLAMELQCPAVGERGTLTVTVGPQGTVRDVQAKGIKQVVVECLQREVRAWIFNELRGGYLKFSFPFPQIDEADLYGDDFAAE